jgi:hypothetical protein
MLEPVKACPSSASAEKEAGSYFFFAGPGRPERNEIPERIAFCWTAAGVLPRVLAACIAVPSLASFFRVFNSLALHEAPSLDGRLAIQVSFKINSCTNSVFAYPTTSGV